MRKFTIIVIALIVNFAAIAQTIVDTIPMNRKAVLEEFTGIHCVYCPDGHKIADQLMQATPGDFFAINIHTGSYATPGAGEPDFRIAFGAPIAAQSGLTGYPAGTINRHLFAGMSQGSGTAQGRANWTATSATLRGLPSYVNLAAQASINLATRELTLLVEGYFTDTLAPASMKLNVALLQNDIEGPQTGGSNFNPSQVLPNGNYNHKHMLRALLTGQWGITIDTTTKGTFFSRTFIYQIPTAIVNVPVELANLEIIAFIAEGNQEIITGNKALISYETPPGVSIIDLSIKDLSVKPALCGTSFTPTLLVKNNSTVVADSFDVEYVYNGGTAVVQNFTTALQPGDSITVTFPAIATLAKKNEFFYNVNVDNVYHLIDITAGNSQAATPVFYIMPPSTFGTIHAETFESYALGASTPNHSILENPTSSPAYTVNQNVSSTVTWDLGAYQGSANSYKVGFYDMEAGKSVKIMFEKLDFTGTEHGMLFDWAYCQYSTENDKLEIKVSDNCGATWTTVWSKAGSALATRALQTASFYPKTNEWKSADVDLNAFNGKPEVIVAFVATSAYGNNLFIDNISIYNQTNSGIENTVSENTVSIYPNPAENTVNFNLNITKNEEVNYTIYNSLGQVVAQMSLGELTSGNHIQNVDISNFAKGVYSINIVVGGEIFNQKLIVK
jgi:hypothetical protein